MARRAELFKTSTANFRHRLYGRSQEFSWIKFGRGSGKNLPNRPGEGHPEIGVDIYISNTVSNAFLNFFNRYAPGRFNIASMCVDDLLEFLRNR